MAVDKRNIFLKNTVETMPFTSTPKPVGTNYPKRTTETHAAFIQRKLQECYAGSLTKEQVAAIRYKDGTYLEFSSTKGYDLAIKSLENRKSGIRLLNVHEDEESDVIRATVYIPAGKESFFLKKAEAYAHEKTLKGRPKNSNLIGSIEDIKVAMLNSFWVGTSDSMPNDTPVWCEIWLRYDFKKDNAEIWKETEESIVSICSDNHIHIDNKHIIFPERIIKMVYANAEQLKVLIATCPYIAEMRRAQEATTFFEDLTNREQKEWIDELLQRINYTDGDVAVCLLDTGITAAHPLLEQAINLDHVQAVNDAWGNGDHQGHGTEMAGIALFNDLKAALTENNKIEMPQKIESVKILPPTGGNDPDLYGAVTEQAVSLAEIANPFVHRVICMAVTSPEYNTMDGSPTSWSAAVDSITSGYAEEGIKRLFVISAGNVYPNELEKTLFPDANTLHCVESPGQAWNAITVGAYSNDIDITDTAFKGYNPVAEVGDMSPYNSTSELWNNKWPVKPDVLFNGGNMASNGTDYSECPDLSLLTTNYRPLIKNFSTIWGTSSATAQAAWFCSQLLIEYPDIWPETVRALMVHSATWTEQMKRRFCAKDTKKSGRRRLLRTCGYGIPNLGRAIQCMNNSVNMVIQGELQPYSKNGMNEMHIHTLPWPTEVLKSLGSVYVTLKVTLSYFIEPGPGEVGWKDKYRYPSCGLRFDVNNSNEDIDDLKKRVNIKMRGDDKKDKGEGTSGSERWYLGSENRDVGSIHSDYCKLTAAELCDCKYIAVFPVVGWWRERSYLGRYDSKIRYSLVVSLSTSKVDVDFYTPIMTEIKNVVETNIATSSLYSG